MSARRQGRIPPALFASFPLTSIPALAAILLGMLALAGCGQMGPLMLPGDQGAEGDDGTASAAGSASGSGSGGENEEGNGSGGENEQ